MVKIFAKKRFYGHLVFRILYNVTNSCGELVLVGKLNRTKISIQANDVEGVFEYIFFFEAIEATNKTQRKQWPRIDVTRGCF